MLPLLAVCGAATLLALGFLWLRAAEIRAARRFAWGVARRSADARFERVARAASARIRVAEHRVAAWLRAAPHRAADLAALVLRLVATRALRALRWLHERRARGHAPAAEASRGSVSFFVSALGEARDASRTAAR